MPNSYSLIVIHKSLVFVCLKKSCRTFVFDTLKRKTLAVLSGSALDCALPGSECKHPHRKKLLTSSTHLLPLFAMKKYQDIHSLKRVVEEQFLR